MDFTYSPAEEQFRLEVRAWFGAYLPDDLRDGRDDHLPQAERWKRHKAWHKQLHAAGWVGIWWPKEYGGRGTSLVEQMIFHQEADRLGAPLGVNVSPIYLFGPTLMHWGTEEQKQRYLPQLLSGEEIWCQGYSEPGAGSDLASLQTRAVEDGDARMTSFAMELLGPYALLDRDSPLALDHGRWVYHTLLARAGLIGAGTSEIQRNIIGERVLGLPK